MKKLVIFYIGLVFLSACSGAGGDRENQGQPPGKKSAIEASKGTSAAGPVVLPAPNAVVPVIAASPTPTPSPTPVKTDLLRTLEQNTSLGKTQFLIYSPALPLVKNAILIGSMSVQKDILNWDLDLTEMPKPTTRRQKIDGISPVYLTQKTATAAQVIVVVNAETALALKTPVIKSMKHFQTFKSYFCSSYYTVHREEGVFETRSDYHCDQKTNLCSCIRWEPRQGTVAATCPMSPVAYHGPQNVSMSHGAWTPNEVANVRDFYAYSNCTTDYNQYYKEESDGVSNLQVAIMPSAHVLQLQVETGEWPQSSLKNVDVSINEAIIDLAW